MDPTYMVSARNKRVRAAAKAMVAKQEVSRMMTNQVVTGKTRRRRRARNAAMAQNNGSAYLTLSPCPTPVYAIACKIQQRYTIGVGTGTTAPEAVLVVAPWGATLGALYSRSTAGTAAVVTDYHVSTQVKAIFDACRSASIDGAVQQRYVTHCVNIVNTNPLATVRGSVYATRVNRDFPTPSTVTNYDLIKPLVVQTPGTEVRSAASLTDVNCLHAYRRGIVAFNFNAVNTSEDDSAPIWESYVYSDVSNNAPYGWGPLVIYFASVGDGGQTYELEYTSVVEFSPQLGSALEPLVATTPIGDLAVMSRRESVLTHGPVFVPKSGAQSRSTQGYLGR